ncbi:MAG: hypothetical protein K5945_10830 [Bacteroidaceae bacterium]|nr:hypothetical protein [Bacteroidaceae bacterium]
MTPEYGMSYFGGIVGINFNSEVRNCLYLGNDVNAYEYFGAIAGTNAYVDSNWQERFSTMNHNFYHGGTLLGIGSSSGSADVPGACRAICMDKIPSGVTEDDYIAYGGKYYVRAGMLLDNGSNAELMAQNQAEGVTNYTLTGRTLWKDGDWNTLCLPFDVTIADATDLRDAEVRELESASFDDASGVLCLNFSDPVEAIEAGKPYIVKFPNEIQYSQYSMARYYDAKAFDGDPSTVAVISMDNHTWPVIFAASGAFNVTGYKLYSPDNMSFLPTKWELRAKLNDGDEWTVIDSRDGSADSDAMPREAGAGKEYALAADKQGLYRYFNLFVTDVDNDGARQMKLGEIELLGDLENQQIYTPTFTDVTLTATEPTPIDCGPVTFQDTYSSTTFTESDQSILFLGAGNKIYYPLESARIGAFRAYFQLNGIAAGAPNTGGAIRSFNLNFDEDSQTGIEMVQEGKGSCVPSVASGKPSARAQDFYDLSGRRVEKATRGIYIRNGRKMIIK